MKVGYLIINIGNENIKQLDKYKIEKDIVISELKTFVTVCQSCDIIPNLSGTAEQKTDLSTIGSGSILTVILV